MTTTNPFQEQGRRDPLRFDERVAIVTGGGGSLGRAYAQLLASRGARVIVNDLGSSPAGSGSSVTPAEEVVADIKRAGGDAVVNGDSVEHGDRIVQCALDHYGRVDIVINNAGILQDSSFHKMSSEQWDLVCRVNLLGTFKVTHAAWPHLRNQNFGRVIMTTSAAGIYGNFGQANYSAAKLGVVGLAHTLAIEGAPRNILVNTIAPVASSRLTEQLFPPGTSESLKPQFVSPLVAYLCHEDTKETDGLFEVGAGWMAKVRWQRTQGECLRTNRDPTPEDVRSHWTRIVDWSDATAPSSVKDTFDKVFVRAEEA